MTTSISTDMAHWIDSLGNDPAGFTDLSSNFQYVNAAAARVFGMQRPLDMIGKTYADMPCGAADFAETFIAHDRYIIETRRSLRRMEVHPYAGGEWKVFILNEKPYIDAADRVIGKTFHAQEITSAYTLAISEQWAKYSGTMQNSFAMSDTDCISNRDIALTQRESEVLFFILRGKTSKLIAAALGGLSYRTVEGYLEKIRLKFGVRNRTELFDVAMERGYMNQIPLSLFSKQLSIVLANE